MLKLKSVQTGQILRYTIDWRKILCKAVQAQDCKPLKKSGQAVLNKDFIEENEDNTVVSGAYDKGNAHDARRRRTVRRRDNRA